VVSTFLIVGLRHDIDTVYGLRRGLGKIVAIEEKHGVRSTFFVRIDVIRTELDCSVLRDLKDRDWEVGLHLINTVNDASFVSPSYELERLKTLVNTEIHGVTPCGSTIGFRGDITWEIMDSLGLDYMQAGKKPGVKTKSFAFPPHLSFDIHYVRNFGEREGYQRFRADLWHKLEQDRQATVLVHPEWFVRTVLSHGLMKIPLTLLRKGLMNRVYDEFVGEFKSKVEFKKYVDIC